MRKRQKPAVATASAVNVVSNFDGIDLENPEITQFLEWIQLQEDLLREIYGRDDDTPFHYQ